MNKEEALKLALEALKDLLDQTEPPPDTNCSCHICPPCNDCVDYSGVRYAIEQANKTITAIKEALAQPEQEPVAWQDTAKHTEIVAAEEWENIDPMWHWMYRPLYTAPPAAQRQPLTNDQIKVIEQGIWKPEFFDDTERQANREFARAIETAHGIGENT